MGVSAQEVIAFHDRILQWLPGVAGMPDPSRAETFIYRVQNRAHYDGVTDILSWLPLTGLLSPEVTFLMMAMSVPRFFVTMTFLYRNGINIRDNDNTLENLTVKLLPGKKLLIS